jgi:DNA polymerase-4
MPLTTLFVDMNAYFASVEQQHRPALRGRPVAVVPVMADTTCCIAASYEAKQYGIRTGTQVGQAKALCPALVIVEARHDLYVRVHHEIADAVESCTHVDAVHSIDEMSCRLLGLQREPSAALDLARRIKQTLRQRVGEYLRCSIGLGPNRLLAKIAADMQKPDGLVTLASEDLPHKLYGLALTDLPGIGRRMAARLNHRGIHTVQRLCECSEADFQSIWQSVVGRRWWQLLRGDDVPDIPTSRRTVGHSHVLPPKLRNEKDARAVLVRLIHKAAARLRSIGYWAKRMSVQVRCLPAGRWHDQAFLGLCQDTVTVVEAFSRLWNRRRLSGRPLQVAVTLFDLVADPEATPSLFAGERQRVQLSHIMDALNNKYGANTVHLAAMHEVQDSAPTRIAFTNIPNLLPAES